MNKTLKKIISSLLVVVTLFNTVSSPLQVLAATIGDDYKPANGDLKLGSELARNNGESVTTTAGKLENPGDIKLTKTVTKKDDNGTYTVTMTVEGKDKSNELIMHPIYTIFVLDASTSMDGTKWTNAKTAASTLSRAMINANGGNNKNEVALITFNQSTRKNTGFRTTAFTNSDFGDTGWYTNYGTGLTSAYNLMQQKKNSLGSNYDPESVFNIVFVSDGAPNCQQKGGTDQYCDISWPSDQRTKDNYNGKNAVDSINQYATNNNLNVTIYSYAYEVASNSYLQYIASDSKVRNTNSSTIQNDMSNLAGDILRKYASDNAKAEDTIGSEFDFAGNQQIVGENVGSIAVENGKVSYNIGRIEEGKVYSYSFDIKIDGDKADGWNPTNDTNDIKVVDTKTGETLVEITESAEVYYERNKYSYTVEYYKDSIESKNKIGDSVNGNNQPFGTTLNETIVGTDLKDTNWINAKQPTGYKAGNVESYITIGNNASSNVIRVLYVKDSFNYVVNYYKDSVSEDNLLGSSDEVNKEYKTTLTEEVISSDLDNEDWINEYKPTDGYKDGEVEGYITITENEDNNVINVIYKKDKFNYVVEYYKDSISDTNKINTTEKVNKEFGTTLTETIVGTDLKDTNWINASKPVDGYKDGVVESYITITSTESKNVIKVLYEKDLYSYVVKFYKDAVNEQGFIGATEPKFEIFGTNVTESVVTEDHGSNWINSQKPTGFMDSEDVTYTTITSNNDNNVVTVVYKRNEYKVTYEYTGVVPETASKLPSEETYKFEEAVKVADPATAPGYTFSGWDKEDFNMPAENVVIRGSFEANSDTKYTVKHYTEKLDGTFELRDTENLKGTTDATVEATPKTYTGFTYDNTVEGTKTSGVVAGDGSLVLSLYYTRNEYKVTYEYTGVVPETASKLPSEETYKFEEAVKVADPATAPGYTFSGWDKEDFNMPADDVVISGEFTPRRDTEYKVEYYFEQLDGSYEMNSDETVTDIATTDTTVEADVKEFDGYVFDSENENNVLSGNVNGDGSLVLKVYYNLGDSKVTVHYVVKVGDKYIPFNIYAKDENGNNTPDFAGVDLEDEILTGKIGSEFTTTYRNVKEYTFNGLYDGNIMNDSTISKLEGISYTGNFDFEELEYTYVYEAPIGDEEPPQTGVEVNSNVNIYMSFIGLTALLFVIKKYFDLITK